MAKNNTKTEQEVMSAEEQAAVLELQKVDTAARKRQPAQEKEAKKHEDAMTDFHKRTESNGDDEKDPVRRRALRK